MQYLSRVGESSERPSLKTIGEPLVGGIVLYLCFWCVHVQMDTRSRLNNYFKAVPFQFGNGSLNVCAQCKINLLPLYVHPL